MNRTGALPRISRAAFIIAAFAFLVRLGFVTAHERPLFSDEIDYDRLGSTLATTGEHSDDGRPTAYRPIGYPALIAGMYAVAGRCPWAVHVAQAALGSLSAILLWLQPVEAARALGRRDLGALSLLDPLCGPPPARDGLHGASACS